ncbi:heme exporter protein CcmB [Vulgatibacter incomptus]|uniref:Heme exporter protein B n=1 Tax=Vulgatibacter incomptus TaxID=1391653 RepID=A0A0K1P9N5_9BACT|nr:heme exporter protein CcmB [Vulgatibacter incomptus]AKU89824.1 ABC transporter involved in cytochrome c biogenesis, CcmB subunit [Vulgatibacter incomptus]
MTQLVAALRKDLLLSWRSRAQAAAVVIFGATALLLLSFAVGPDAAALRRLAGGFLWVALLFSSTLALAESFRAETEQRALEGLLLLPANAPSLFYGKALANWLQLLLVGVGLLPVLVVLYDPDVGRLPALCGILALGTAGLSAPGTLYAGMSAQVRAQQVLLPLLLFPLVVPVLLAAVKASSLLLLGDPMGQAGSWALLLLAFNGIFWPLCGLLFGHVIEE